jgi:GT2 family glycosyltransferase
VEAARALGVQVIELQQGLASAARARNAGWRIASAEWVLFLDGDTVLDPEFPLRALEAAERENADVVWGHRREIRPTANVYHRVLDLDWVYAPGETEFCGGDALMRRRRLEETGGFDESLIAGEEPELCARLRAAGARILHIDAAMTWHDLAITRWSQYWKRATRAGYAYAQLAWRTRRNSVPMWVRESRGNAARALALSLLLGAAAWWPWQIAALMGALACRSAYRARWKDGNLLSLLSYGVHSHLQQLPIFAGQCAFWWDHIRGSKRGLIEYK